MGPMKPSPQRRKGAPDPSTPATVWRTHAIAWATFPFAWLLPEATLAGMFAFVGVLICGLGAVAYTVQFRHATSRWVQRVSASGLVIAIVALLAGLD